MRIKIKTHAAQYITAKDWHDKCAPMPEIDRPVVLKIDERRGLVKIRPKTYGEVLAAQRSMIKQSIRQGSFVTQIPPALEEKIGVPAETLPAAIVSS